MSEGMNNLAKLSKKDLIFALKEHFFGVIVGDRPLYGFGTMSAVFGSDGYNKCHKYVIDSDIKNGTSKAVIIAHDTMISTEGYTVQEYVVIADPESYINISPLLSHLYKDTPSGEADFVLNVFESRYSGENTPNDTKVLTSPSLNSELVSGGIVSDGIINRDFWYAKGEAVYQLKGERETKFSFSSSKDIGMPTFLKVGHEREWLGIDLSWTKESNKITMLSNGCRVTNILFVPADKLSFADLPQK